MSIKVAHRKSVPSWLRDAANLDGCSFPLNEALRQSLYYPASGFDGRPVQFLGGFVHSFIYVDYGNSEERVDAAIVERPFDGYEVVCRKALKEEELTPNGWYPRVPNKFHQDVRKFSEYARQYVKPPFATWFILDRLPGYHEDHGPKRFSLVYLCADGVAAYQALYSQNGIAPCVLAMIQPGSGFGLNYTNFHSPDGFFAGTVMHGSAGAVPEYMLCDSGPSGAYWSEAYPHRVEFWPQSGISLWQHRQL